MPAQPSMGGASWQRDRGSWRWWGRGCCRNAWRRRWRTSCGSFSRGAGASARAARGARTTTRSTRCWRRGRRRARARWCSSRGPCPRGRTPFTPSWGEAGAWCPAPAGAGSPSSRAHGGSRGRRPAWSRSCGARRAGRCSPCGKRSGRGSRPRWCSRAAAPSCRRSAGADGRRAPSDRCTRSGGIRSRGTHRGPSWLARVFHVPAGEPTHAQLEHIASLSAGERLWFERGILAGDTVLVPHEALSDTPAFLATRRLMRRFRCDVREAAGLAELFLALEAGPGVVAHYEHEARGVGVTAIIEDLVHLVACLALSEQAPETDALGHADALGDGVEWVDDSGRVAQAAVQSREEAAPPDVQWHALGTVQPERVTCPVCRAVIESDRRVERPADLRRVRHAGHLGSAAGRALPRHRRRDRRLLLPRSAGGARQATLCARAHARSGWRRVVALPRVQDGPRAGRDAPAARARPRRSRGARHAALPSAARGAAVPVAARWRRVHLHHRVAADLGGVPGAPGRGRRVGRPRAVAAGRRARSAMLTRVARPSACTPPRTPWPRSPTCAAEQARRGFDRAPGTRCSRAWRGRRPQSPTRRVTSLGSASIARAERECSRAWRGRRRARHRARLGRDRRHRAAPPTSSASLPRARRHLGSLRSPRI